MVHPAQSPRSRFVILVAVDGTSLDADVARYAAGIARDIARGELHFVHSCDSLDAHTVYTEEPHSLADAITLKVATETLTRAMGEARRVANGTLVGHLTPHRAGKEILQLATDLNADLIVCGTRDLPAIRRVALGSVSEALVKRAHCPVLVVRPKMYASRPVEIDPPCADCSHVQASSGGAILWCEQHSHRKRRMHTYSDARPVGFGEGSMFVK